MHMLGITMTSIGTPARMNRTDQNHSMTMHMAIIKSHAVLSQTKLDLSLWETVESEV